MGFFSFKHFTHKKKRSKFVYIKKTMREIIVKEIDTLTSKLHKGRVITEYLIYLMENDVKLACYSVIGDEAKNNKIIELENNNNNIKK
jgi:hypothetical protein